MSAKSIETEALRLLKHPGIARGIEQYRQSKRADTLLTLEAHMIELQTLRDMAKTNGQMSAAIKAEELRGKLRGFYVERVEHGDMHAFDQMSDDELRRFVTGEIRALNLNARPPTDGHGGGKAH